MSRRHVVAGHHVYLVRSAAGTYRVFASPLGRMLGYVYSAKSRWTWTTTRSAFRGDGRPESLSDGMGDQVPPELDASGRAVTQEAAVRALVTYLAAASAPALGYPPHPEVRSVANTGGH